MYVYTGALADAERELEELLGQKRWIDQRIAVLRDAIANMQYLGENQQPPQETGILERLVGDLGLTDSCREVLKSARSPLSPADVIGQLELGGYDVRRYKNPYASICTVLKRLVAAGESETVVTPGGTLYKWRFLPAPLPWKI